MKNLSITCLFLLTAFIAMAQPNRKGDRIESMKIAHISSRLNLDPQTAERFWPVYNQYENELLQVVMERRRMNQSDSRSAEDILDQEQKALDIKKKYNTQFQRIISADQLNTLYGAEKEFRQMLIRKARRNDAEQFRQGGDDMRRNRNMDMPRNDRQMQPQQSPARATPPRQPRMEMNRGMQDAPARSNRMDKPSR